MSDTIPPLKYHQKQNYHMNKQSLASFTDVIPQACYFHSEKITPPYQLHKTYH